MPLEFEELRVCKFPIDNIERVDAIIQYFKDFYSLAPGEYPKPPAVWTNEAANGKPDTLLILFNV